MVQYTRVLIVSAEEAVSDFINALPSLYPLHDGPGADKQDPLSRFSTYFRKIIDNHDDFLFDVFGFAGDIQRFDFILEIAVEGIPGMIILVDPRRAETLENSKILIALIRAYNQQGSTPKAYLIVGTSPDTNPGLVRAQFGLEEGEHLAVCDLSDLNSIKSVLLTLIRLIPEYATVTRLVTALTQL